MRKILVDRGWAVILASLVVLFLVAWFAEPIVKTFWATPPMSGAQLAWLFGLVAVFFGVLVAGIAINGRWSGAFIDSRNRYSLAQVQAVLWLIVVSSGIVAAGVGNVRQGIASPLDLAIPPELLAVIGISVTTLVGTPIIRAVKRDNDPDPGQAQRTINGLGAARVETSPDPAAPQVFGFSAPADTVPSMATDGSIITFTDPKQTPWVDLLRGEETGNADKVDLGKLQLLYVTAAAIFVYGMALFANLNPAADAAGHAVKLVFADLDASMVGILGLSHAGALAYLAAPHAKTSE